MLYICSLKSILYKLAAFYYCGKEYYIMWSDHLFTILLLQYVNITPLVKLPDNAVVRYLGVVSLFLIRETTAVRGVSGNVCNWRGLIQYWELSFIPQLRGVDHFVHMFIAEANAIARAHVAAMNGNMLLGYKVNECVLIDSSSHKNQVQHMFFHCALLTSCCRLNVYYISVGMQL